MFNPFLGVANVNQYKEQRMMLESVYLKECSLLQKNYCKMIKDDFCRFTILTGVMNTNLHLLECLLLTERLSAIKDKHDSDYYQLL